MLLLDSDTPLRRSLCYSDVAPKALDLLSQCFLRLNGHQILIELRHATQVRLRPRWPQMLAERYNLSIILLSNQGHFCLQIWNDWRLLFARLCIQRLRWWAHGCKLVLRLRRADTERCMELTRIWLVNLIVLLQVHGVIWIRSILFLTHGQVHLLLLVLMS